MSEANEQDTAPSVGDISYQSMEGYRICIDGEPVAMVSYMGVELTDDEVPDHVRQRLLDDAIGYEENVRSREKSYNAIELGAVTTLGFGGFAITGFEVSQSNSNWLKAAWAAGTFICSLIILAGSAGIVETIRNKVPETKLPTKRIEALENLKQELSPQ